MKVLIFNTKAQAIARVVEVIASHEDPQTGARAPVAQGQFQMVAVNEHGRPQKITAQEIST